MRHKLALLVLLCGVLTMAACGDDNDTPVPTPTPVDTQVPPPPTTPPTQGPPTDTPTESSETPPATATPTATGGTTEVVSFSCDFRTSFTCVGGSRDGEVCRSSRATPLPEDLCPGGECMETEFFCKGGDIDGQACQRPRNTRTPEPCTGGGRCQNSELQICTQGTCPIVSRRLGGGRIDIQCNSGSGDCTATLDEFDPVDIPGIGFVCVDPRPDIVCPAGQVQCAGGPGLDYDLLQVHTIGACGVPGDPNDTSGNPSCQSMCQQYCQGMDAEMVDFGCTGYCKSGGDPEGSKTNLACDCDGPLGGGGACESLNHCAPNGSCNGKDRAAARDRNVCGCQCLTEGGNASRPGAVNFRVGAQIIVETAPPCGSGAVLLALPGQCIPLTTEISTGALTRANNPTNPEACPNGLPAPGCPQIPAEGKLERKGVPVTCEDLMQGTASGMNIVGNISFFDSTIGDIETVLDWACR